MRGRWTRDRPRDRGVEGSKGVVQRRRSQCDSLSFGREAHRPPPKSWLHHGRYDLPQAAVVVRVTRRGDSKASSIHQTSALSTTPTDALFFLSLLSAPLPSSPFLDSTTRRYEHKRHTQHTEVGYHRDENQVIRTDVARTQKSFRPHASVQFVRRRPNTTLTFARGPAPYQKRPSCCTPTRPTP